MKLSKARRYRASVRGKILMLRFWGKEYGKVLRLKRYERYYCLECDFVHSHPRPPHPRRALIVTDSGITPVRLKGK